MTTGLANARTGGEEVVQVVGEGIELGDHRAVDLGEEVEREHGRDRDEQADRGHDQRFTHRAGNGVDGGRTGCTDLDQRAVDAPHGAEQTDERRGRTDGGQQGHARLQLGAFAGHGLTQGAVDELRTAQALAQATGAAFGALVVRSSLGCVQCDLGERLGSRLFFHGADGVLCIRGIPERGGDAVSRALQAGGAEDVDDSPVPGGSGHGDQGDQHDPGHGEVAGAGSHFGDQVLEAHLRQSGRRIGAPCSGGDKEFLQHDAYLCCVW
ncbi:hypothetical protein XAC2852_10012 [Xanthomonas citri pv. citri]|nr:hypothetical protein XAC2852_10012 [Xanthomonas citri pv. citri]